jgi:hypothetical protein
MLVEVDYKRIQKILNDCCPEHPVTEAEAAQAFHNMVSFIKILDQINNRVKLVPNTKKKI